MFDWRLMIALRYALSGRKDQMVSFISRVSVTGLVLGVAVLVLVLSVMNGFEHELRTRVLGVVPHGVIYHRSSQFESHTLDQLRTHPAVTALAPLVEGSGLLVANGNLRGVSFAGVDPEQERGVSVVHKFMSSGEFSTESVAGFGVVIGSNLAGHLGVFVGDRVTLVLPDVMLGLAGPVPTQKRLRVSGIFQTGSDIDKQQIYLGVQDALRLNRQSSVSAWRVSLDDLFEAPSVLYELVMMTGEADVYGVSWMRRHGNLYDAIQMQKSTMFLLLSMLIAVAAFNVVSNLVLMVNDKRGDIAILRSAGASPNSIRGIFLVQGCVIGVAGIAIGIVLGVLGANHVGTIYRFIEQRFHLGLMEEYFIQYLPSKVLVSDVMVVALVSFILCVLASLYPAGRAAATRPAEVLQYE